LIYEKQGIGSPLSTTITRALLLHLVILKIINLVIESIPDFLYDCNRVLRHWRKKNESTAI
jgi:hypothetical protein